MMQFVLRSLDCYCSEKLFGIWQRITAKMRTKLFRYAKKNLYNSIADYYLNETAFV